MSDVNNKYPHLSPIQAANAERADEKIKAVAKIRKLSQGSDWTILQDIAQDIIASATVENPKARLIMTELRRTIISEVNKRYQEEPELKDLLLDAVPSEQSINAWLKKDKWEEAVWSKIHGTGLFTKENRTAMIDALFRRGIEKDTTAAKIWLTLSGDYIEKSQVDNKDSTIDKYREINNILHSKKEK